MPYSQTNQFSDDSCSRRTALKQCVAGVLAAGAASAADPLPAMEPLPDARPWIKIRGIYGGFPNQLIERGETPADYGVNAIWVGSGGLIADDIERYHELGVKVFAEFNSMHSASYLKEHPDAAPIGPDGKPSPPPHGWQGVSPFHAGYRQNRMQEFRRVLETFDIDGIWLDYHHAHASWERDEPSLPDTDFSPAALKAFTQKTGMELPADTAAAARILLGNARDQWTDFRCEVLTDWVREYREILDDVRPKALLGTFHCPWSPEEKDGAIRHKLAIDLKSQARYLDVFSIMPYHARFGHVNDPGWIGRQTAMLGKLLGIEGKAGEKKQIWPICQVSDWGEAVVPEQIGTVIENATRPPATGIMVFHWNQFFKDANKLDALKHAYLKLGPMQDAT